MGLGECTNYRIIRKGSAGFGNPSGFLFIYVFLFTYFSHSPSVARQNLKEAGFGEPTNPRAKLWPDEQKSHINSHTRISLQYKIKSDGYTESHGIDEVGKNGKGIYIRVHAKSWKKVKDKLGLLCSCHSPKEGCRSCGTPLLIFTLLLFFDHVIENGDADTTSNCNNKIIDKSHNILLFL